MTQQDVCPALDLPSLVGVSPHQVVVCLEDLPEADWTGFQDLLSITMVLDSWSNTTSCIRPTGFAYLGPTPFGMLCQRSAPRPSAETQHDAIPPPMRGKNE